MSMGLTADLPEGVIEPVAMPGNYGPVPAGTTASRCQACGEIRLHYPGDLRDPWKKHFDHCAGDGEAGDGIAARYPDSPATGTGLG
jgi:hypothetical protein